MDKNYVHDLFSRFQSLNILVIGDVMVDSYLWGKVERISPEAPVPIVSGQKRENRLGGAANVALNLKNLGAKPLLCSAIGTDATGDIFFELMKKELLPSELMIHDASRKTTSKTRVISGSQQLLRVDEESAHSLNAEVEKLLIDKILKFLTNEHVQAIIFQDYDKGIITPSLIENVVIKAQSMNIPTLADPKKRNFSHYRRVNLFKPNLKEFSEGIKKDIDLTNMNSLAKESKLFLEETGNQLLLLTLSEKGVFISDASKHLIVPAHARDITDVSGAGDTVISTAALCLAAGCNPSEIAALSNLAGGLVCEKVGVIPVDRQHFMEESLKLDVPKW